MPLRCLTVAAVLALTACSMQADRAAAQAAVAQFHAQLDAEQYAAIYAGTAPELRKVSSADKFSALLAAVHRKLGKVKSATRQTRRVNYNTAGTFVTLVYATVFEGGHASEEFVYRFDPQPALAATTSTPKHWC